MLGDFGQGFAAVGDTDQRVLRQRLPVYLILEVVVFDDQEGRGACQVGLRTGRMRVKVLPWSTTDSTAMPASIRLASS